MIYFQFLKRFKIRVALNQIVQCKRINIKMNHFVWNGSDLNIWMFVDVSIQIVAHSYIPILDKMIEKFDT